MAPQVIRFNAEQPEALELYASLSFSADLVEGSVDVCDGCHFELVFERVDPGLDSLEPGHHDAFARAFDEVLAQHGDVLFDG